MLDLIEEEADAALLFADRMDKLRRPVEADWPVWSGYLRDAFDTLRDDRHVGDMGGLGRIYFTAIDRYARRFGIAGSDFDAFQNFLRALDDEFLSHVAAKRKAEAEKSKQENN